MSLEEAVEELRNRARDIRAGDIQGDPFNPFEKELLKILRNQDSEIRSLQMKVHELEARNAMNMAQRYTQRANVALQQLQEIRNSRNPQILSEPPRPYHPGDLR